MRCARGSLCPLACTAYARTTGAAQRQSAVGVSAAGASHVATTCRSPAARLPSPRMSSPLSTNCFCERPWTSPCMMSSVGARAPTRPLATTPRAAHWHVASRRPAADRAVIGGDVTPAPSQGWRTSHHSTGVLRTPVFVSHRLARSGRDPARVCRRCSAGDWAERVGCLCAAGNYIGPDLDDSDDSGEEGEEEDQVRELLLWVPSRATTQPKRVTPELVDPSPYS